MTDKYEAELQRIFNGCNQDWETVARVLFDMHPNIIKERQADSKKLALAFNPRRKNHIRGKTLHDIWEMLDRIERVMYGPQGHRRYTSRKAALATGLGLRGKNLENWEKILSTYTSQHSRLKKSFNSAANQDLLSDIYQEDSEIL